MPGYCYKLPMITDPVSPDADAAVAIMKKGWNLPTAWDFDAANGITGTFWDKRCAASHHLPCNLSDTHLILSLNASDIVHADVSLEGRRQYFGGMKRGSWMLVASGSAPDAVTSGAFSLLHVYIPIRLLRDACNAYDLGGIIPEKVAYLHGTNSGHPVVKHAADLIAAHAGQDRLRRLQIDTSCQSMVTEILRAFDAPTDQVDRLSLTPWQRARLEEYLKEEFCNDIDLAQLADVAGLSKYHFLRAFKSSFQRTPMAEVTERRLSHAADHLRENRLSITQIALKCGFSDHSHFSATFKRRFGVTPSRYRRMDQ
ncbi:helix-turn-helix transcriptional regulator [Litoreibacter roseus]|uniref:HTH araC/xylS-type domain-containing protein n=1 Tax=Litoreibacter roseus TaxID=2601869 RepID=A0A6N6JL84_9RHOB|nr:AraC family transcriptional regulator [Litoreibacter roseus]GFE66169.1 hypothetical protein KIN_32430 [Litoreibacter roseus]